VRPGTAKPLGKREVIPEEVNESMKELRSKILNDDMSIYSSAVVTKSSNSTHNVKKMQFRPYFPKYANFQLKRKSAKSQTKKFGASDNKEKVSKRSGISSKRDYDSICTANNVILI
jgi:hypothetical protein